MMKNTKLTKALVVALSCLLLVGVAFGVMAYADSSEGAKSVEIEYKNVSYKGAPSLVYYVGTDAPLADNQKVKLLFWNNKNVTGLYNEHTAEYAKYAESETVIEGKTYQTFLGNGVAPSEVRINVYARPALVEVDEDGNEKVVALGKLLEYSIFEYALEMFNAKVNGTRSNAADDQVEIYKAFLNYAASIQKKLFTNKYNGVLNKEKLDKVGGWANAYYVVQVNRYLYDSVKHEYVADGEYTRYSEQNAGAEIDVVSPITYTKGSTTYAFKTYRDANGNAVNVLRNAGGVDITAKSVFSNEYKTSAQNPGVIEYNAYYGIETGKYITMDGGQSLESFKDDAVKFWAQYDANGANPKNTISKSEITIYYYQHTPAHEKQEIVYFYTKDGKASEDAHDYHYAAVTNTGTLAKETIKSEDLSNYTFIDVDGSDERISKETYEMHSRGYSDYVKAPYTAEGENRGNALAFVKHFYDLKDPNKTTYLSGPSYGNESAGGYKTSGYLTTKGSLKIADDGSSVSMLTANASFDFNNKSPSTVADQKTNNVHIVEMDICVEGDQYDTSIVQLCMNGGGPLKIDIGINSDDETFYIFDEVSPGPAKKNGTLYKADGTKITSGVIAGTKKSCATIGKSMNQKAWYNFRLEYVDLPNDTAVVLYYIDHELVSYMVGNPAASDNVMSKFGFNFATGTRCGYLYVDNVYLATEGNYKPELPEEGEGGDVVVEYYNDVYGHGEGDFHGQGKYFGDSAQIDKSHKPANGLKSGVSIVEEKLSDGTKNFALQMLKTANSGFSASYGVANPGGNFYIFETDVKVIGSDNTKEWMLKLSFQDSGISSPGNDKEFAMVCILYKNGYWTIGNQSTPLDPNFKFKLEQWHNLRLEFNPANDELQVYVNNKRVYQKDGYGRAGKGSDATYAGMNINVRKLPEGSKYTEILFDNIYTTTEYRDYHGAGANFDKSEKYENYTPSTEGVTVQGTENKYINNTKNTITLPTAHNRGHQYLFETDIRWNGAAGFENTESTTAKVLEFVMKSGNNDIFSINGITTNNPESDLMLKIGTVTVATLSREYWMNLRIAYTPHEVEITEEGEELYKATYTIYINGAQMYTATVECDPYDTFDKSILTIDGEEGVVPNIDIDNIYTAAVYVDDHKNGENYDKSNKYVDDKKVDGDVPVADFKEFKSDVSIGSIYLFETDIKWVEGSANIALESVEGTDFVVYIIPDAENAGYAKLSLTDKIEDAFFTIYNNIWYNVQIAAENGIYTVKVSGKERISVERDLAKTCKGAMVNVSGGSVVIDNDYMLVENKDYLGNGVNKGNALPSFTQADKDGEIIYDANLKEADPDNKYTDAYITISKSQIVLGKNTATSENVLKVLGGKDADLHIFESDLIWGGTEWGVETGIGNSEYGTYFTVTINDEEGNAVFTVYAVGTYAIDTINKDAQFLKLYTSLDDVKANNAFAYVQANVAFNLRVEYAATGAYEIYVNNEKAATGNGTALKAMGSADIALGTSVYDTKVSIKNVYVGSK